MKQIFVFFTILVAITTSKRVEVRKIGEVRKTEEILPKKCKECMPGWGLVSLCDSNQETKCEICLPGFFAPNEFHSSPCQLCSECGPGLYVDRPCSEVSDTICDSCQNTKGNLLNNPDYVQKCLNGPKDKTVINSNVVISNGLKLEDSVPYLGDEHHRFWNFNPDSEISVPEIKFKPSNHNYPTDMKVYVHWQYRKFYILLASVSLMIVMAAIFIIFLVRSHHQRKLERQKYHYYQCLTQISPEQKAIFADCARRLESNEAEKQSRPNSIAVSESLSIHDNPLERLLNEEK